MVVASTVNADGWAINPACSTPCPPYGWGIMCNQPNGDMPWTRHAISPMFKLDKENLIHFTLSDSCCLKIGWLHDE